MKIPVTGGEIKLQEIGFTLVHEHLKTESEAVKIQWPHIYSEELAFKNAVEEVKRAKSLGVSTICDASVMGLGRDVRFIERVAKEAKINVVVATGVYLRSELPFYFLGRNEEEIAELFVHDIKNGIQGTQTKAAFLKVTTDPSLTQDVELALKAVAIAHEKTKAPIYTHTNAHMKTGLEQQRIFKEMGVDLARVCIGHTGDTTDMDYIKKILGEGSFVGLDRYGLDYLLPVEERNKVLQDLIKDGFADQILVSQDYCCSIDWGIAKPEKNPCLHQVENPQRFLGKI